MDVVVVSPGCLARGWGRRTVTLEVKEAFLKGQLGAATVKHGVTI